MAGEAALFSGSLSFFALVGLFMMLTGSSDLEDSIVNAENCESTKNESSILV